eukprot:NODE_363_length_10100_cov_0.133787.p6 type:complete len:135 gc:universal NODE_363_length_10100_cov_0.133787:538-942(+)
MTESNDKLNMGTVSGSCVDELPSLKFVLTNANIEYRLPSDPINIRFSRKTPISVNEDHSRNSIDLPFTTQCKVCNKNFKNVHAKKKHQSSVHGPKLPCEYCGKKLKVYGRTDLMKQHLDRCKRYKAFLEDNVEE